MFTNLSAEVSDAVQYYWETRSGQAKEQRKSDNSTRGKRAEVLGGQQMDSFAGLIEDILVEEAGISPNSVQADSSDRV